MGVLMALSTAGVCGSVYCCLLQEVYVGVFIVVCYRRCMWECLLLSVTGGVCGSVYCCLLQEVYVGVFIVVCYRRCMWEC